MKPILIPCVVRRFVSYLLSGLRAHRRLMIAVSVVLPCVVLAFSLRAEASYSGFESTDMKSHLVYLRLLLDAFHRGSLGLDIWDPHEGFGVAIFRVYQNLSYLFVAAFCFVFQINDLVRALHSVIVVCLAAQPIVFFYSARRIGFSIPGSIAAAWLAPCVSSAADFGHEFSSYLFKGFGLFTQAPGILCLVLGIGAITEFVRSVSSEGSQMQRRSIEIGAWIGLTFLVHHFCGYMLCLYLGGVVAMALAARWLRCFGLIRFAALAGLIVLAIIGYQLLSIAQDSALMHRSQWDLPSRWDGIGIASVLRTILKGKVLDNGRFPTLSLLALVGLVGCCRLKSARGERCLLVLLVLGVAFWSGRVTFGRYLNVIPGITNIHLERFVILVQLAGIFLAAWGLGASATWVASGLRSRWLARVAAVAWIGCLAFGLYTIVADRRAYLKADSRWLAEQNWENSFLDRRLFTSAQASLRLGSLWSFIPASPMLPLLGHLPYFGIATSMGYNQLSALEQAMTYPTDLVYHFNPYRESHYRIFDISTAIVPDGYKGKQAVTPPFLRRVYGNYQFATYIAPSALGIWDVIGVSSVKQVENETEYSKELANWLDVIDVSVDAYPVIVPRAIVKRWPRAIPRSTSSSAGAWGKIIHAEPLADGRSRAVLFASRPHAYGVIRETFHPRWRIRVNGKITDPLWIGPGFVGFELTQGINQVEIEFPADPLRCALFFLGMLTLTGIGCYLLVPRLLAFASKAWEKRSLQIRWARGGQLRGAEA